MTKKQSILMVLESIDIDDSSGTKGRVALIRNLKALGYKLKVLHYTRKDIILDHIETISIAEKKISWNYVLSRIRRLAKRHMNKDWLKKKEDHGFSYGFLNDSNSISAAIKSNYNGEDMIITLSKGSSFRPHHAMLSLPEFHHKWVAYVHDPYPFHLYPKPYDWVEPGHKQKEAFFRQVSEKASVAVFPSKLLKEWMTKFFPVFENTGVVIPHQIVAEEKADIPVNLPEYFNEKKFNLLHSGNLMKPRNPEALIAGIKAFLSSRPEAAADLRLILLGKADYFKKLLIEEQENCSWLYASLSYIPYEQTQLMQLKASVNIIIEAKAEVSPFLPGKFPHCVVSDKPILALSPAKSEVRRLLGEDYLYQCENDDVKSITSFIEGLYHRWKTSPDQLRLERPDLHDYLGTENLKVQMLEVFNRLEKTTAHHG